MARREPVGQAQHGRPHASRAAGGPADRWFSRQASVEARRVAAGERHPFEHAHSGRQAVDLVAACQRRLDRAPARAIAWRRRARARQLRRRAPRARPRRAYSAEPVRTTVMGPVSPGVGAGQRRHRDGPVGTTRWRTARSPGTAPPGRPRRGAGARRRAGRGRPDPPRSAERAAARAATAEPASRRVAARDVAHPRPEPGGAERLAGELRKAAVGAAVADGAAGERRLVVGVGGRDLAGVHEPVAVGVAQHGQSPLVRDLPTQAAVVVEAQADQRRLAASAPSPPGSRRATGRRAPPAPPAPRLRGAGR